ncbi:MAG: HAMP domain-containing histidine kinase [Pseudomonadota bacterium]|nr:HAMP domain-containing histidine kinase [Pseudomonadota bacterium]
MIRVELPDLAPVDWDDWSTPLQQFSAATGLVACAYDAEGTRRIGPLTGTRLGVLLAGSSLWNDDGAGTRFEREQVAATCASGQPVVAQFAEGLRVQTQPLLLRGVVYGVVVFGWRFADFSSPLACERIARQIGVPGHVLWNEVRLDAPVSVQRMGTYAALLGTLSQTLDRQRETIDELTRVSRTRELFLATVSHEMRTPLSALSMRIELLLRSVPALAPEVLASLESMRIHVRQEAGMVDDLIDAARTLTGQMSIERAPVLLSQVLHDAISTVETHAHAKHILMQVTPSDYGSQFQFNADARRLQQVIWNLLFNAIKFTPDGGVIRIAARRLDGMLEIDIADTGQGIAQEDLAHVFGAFNLQQQNNGTGLGLGLYIARRIVELHGGTLSVSSPGRGLGATFAIRLPL